MSQIPNDIDWSLTSWEGSRREQLRRWRLLSLRQRLLALEQMSEIAECFGRMRESRKVRARVPQGKITAR